MTWRSWHRGLHAPPKPANGLRARDCPVTDEASQKEDEGFMARALAEAEAARREAEVPVGAIVVCGGVVVGQGHNRREALADPTSHAEMLAIREAARARASWRLEDCTLYVTLEPCVMCAGAIVQARVKRLGVRLPGSQGGRREVALPSLRRCAPEPSRGRHRGRAGGTVRRHPEAILCGPAEPGHKREDRMKPASASDSIRSNAAEDARRGVSAA